MASKIEAKARKAIARKGGKRARDPAGGKSEQPLYLQVVHALKDEIVRGVHPVGSQLPTEEELSERFAVSRYTIREALRLLREDHLVSSRKGAGTTVVTPRASDSYVHEVMSINDLVAFATGVRFRIDSIEMIVADAALARADRLRSPASAGSRCAGFGTPTKANRRCAGPKSTSTRNSPRSAGCCNAIPARSSI